VSDLDDVISRLHPKDAKGLAARDRRRCLERIPPSVHPLAILPVLVSSRGLKGIVYVSDRQFVFLSTSGEEAAVSLSSITGTRLSVRGAFNRRPEHLFVQIGGSNEHEYDVMYTQPESISWFVDTLNRALVADGSESSTAPVGATLGEAPLPSVEDGSGIAYAMDSNGRVYWSCSHEIQTEALAVALQDCETVEAGAALLSSFGYQVVSRAPAGPDRTALAVRRSPGQVVQSERQQSPVDPGTDQPVDVNGKKHLASMVTTYLDQRGLKYVVDQDSRIKCSVRFAPDSPTYTLVFFGSDSNLVYIGALEHRFPVASRSSILEWCNTRVEGYRWPIPFIWSGSDDSGIEVRLRYAIPAVNLNQLQVDAFVEAIRIGTNHIWKTLLEVQGKLEPE
jgi:hypothetical protein